GRAADARDDDAVLPPRALGVDLRIHSGRALRGDDHRAVPRLILGEAHVDAGQAVAHPAAFLVIGVDVDEDHLHREAVAAPGRAVPGVLDARADADAELHRIAGGHHLEFGDVERAGLVDRVGGVGVVAGAVVVAGRVGEGERAVSGAGGPA